MACDEKNFENHIWLVVSNSVSLQDIPDRGESRLGGGAAVPKISNRHFFLFSDFKSDFRSFQSTLINVQSLFITYLVVWDHSESMSMRFIE